MTEAYYEEPIQPSYFGEYHTAATGERTVAQRIFFDRFWVHVPEYFYQTKESLEMYGTYETGDKNVNRQLMLQKRRLFIPIAGMCIYLEEGAEIVLDDPLDSVTIYKLLMEHLSNWEYVTGQMNAPIPPLEDLRTMDLFAEMLFPAANAYLKQGAHRTGLWARLDVLGHIPVDDTQRTAMERLNGLAGGPMQRPGLSNPVADGKQPENPPGHRTIADLVAKQTFNQKWTD